MNTRIICLIVALVAYTHGHMYLSSITVGGQDQGERNCLRPLYSGGGTTYPNSPIQDLKQYTRGLTGANMTCGFLPYAANPANRKCPVNAGSVVGITWHHESTAGTDQIVEESHKGPCMVYMARSDTGSGAVWFKVYEEGYNFQTKQWCTMRLRASKGYLEFTIPATIPSGNYLIRTETFGLHEGNQVYGAQPYVGCAEVTVTGANPGVMPTSDFLVSFPGAYGYNDPGIVFNVYNTFTSYTVPGPKVYTASAVTNTGTPTPTSNPTSTPTGTPTSNPTSSPTSSPNPTTDDCVNTIVNACVTLCGTRGTVSCKCENGNPNIICAGAETSSASTLRPFWFL